MICTYTKNKSNRRKERGNFLLLQRFEHEFDTNKHALLKMAVYRVIVAMVTSTMVIAKTARFDQNLFT